MPTFRSSVMIRDSSLEGDQEYSFNGHVVGANTTAAFERAIEVAESLVGTVLPPNCVVFRVGVSNPDVINGTRIEPQLLAGTRAITGLALPGWNVARVQFAIASGVRLHTFYLRMGLTEDDVAGQALTGPTQDAIGDFISAYTLTGANSDKDGFPFILGNGDTFVHMRQLGWRRRTRPGFKRGWVPV